jgi:hypothetical protein
MSLPPDPTPHGSPPADAGALGAAKALLPFVAFVRLVGAIAGIIVDSVTSLQQCGNSDAGYDPLEKPMV